MRYLTKKHLSRRTVLRGAGVAIALPFLESMIPAGVRDALGGRRAARRGSRASTFRTAAS